MSIVDFDSLKVTTMTVIVELIGDAEIEYIFPLLNFTRLDLPKKTRQTKKFKIPFCDIPGAILSARYKDITRGIVKSKSNKYFRNSITIDLCTSRKHVSIKLSRNIIHMCGPDSRELVVESAEHILKHIKSIQSDLDYIKENREIHDITLNWVKEKSKGEYYIVDSETQEVLELDEGETLKLDDKISTEDFKVSNILMMNGEFKTKIIETPFEAWGKEDSIEHDNILTHNIYGTYYMIDYKTRQRVPCIYDTNFFIKPLSYDEDGNVEEYTFVDNYGNPFKTVRDQIITAMEVHSLNIPEEYPDNYPSGIDRRIANFYIKQEPNYNFYHVFCQYVECVKDIERVMSPNLSIGNINMAMINYSYSLGMSVNRWKLASTINGRDGFIVKYNNTTDHCVTISLPYELTEEMKKIRRKNKKTCHTFMVYKSGTVTQSGPNVDMMREAYEKFRNIIKSIKDEISNEGKEFNLKYIPVAK